MLGSAPAFVKPARGEAGFTKPSRPGDEQTIGSCGRQRGCYVYGMTVKERLHNAVETMTDEEASSALRTLAEASGDPVAWMLDHAPLDDESETEEERRAVAEARADRERGVEPLPLDRVLAEFDEAR